MQSGPFTRSRKSQRQYNQHITKTKSKSCDFCEFTAKSADVKKSFKYFWIVNNIFGYDIWDSQGVKEHLMIVPKKHVTAISKLPVAAQNEYLKILNSYEDKGYSIYSRSVKNMALSVAHKHTHLIKMNDKRKKMVLFIRKPHALIHF